MIFGTRAENNLKRAENFWLCDKKLNLDGGRERYKSDRSLSHNRKEKEATHQSCNSTVSKGQFSFVPALFDIFSQYVSR